MEHRARKTATLAPSTPPPLLCSLPPPEKYVSDLQMGRGPRPWLVAHKGCLSDGIQWEDWWTPGRHKDGRQCVHCGVSLSRVSVWPFGSCHVFFGFPFLFLVFQPTSPWSGALGQHWEDWLIPRMMGCWGIRSAGGHEQEEEGVGRG